MTPLAHTQGEWKAVHRTTWNWCVQVGKTVIAFRLKSEGDAKLISAAPELFYALEELAVPVAWFDGDVHSCRFCYADNPGAIQHTEFCIITRSRTALVKAGRL